MGVLRATVYTLFSGTSANEGAYDYVAYQR
jgi:hypothetical protein